MNDLESSADTADCTFAAGVAKAIGHPTRLHILDILSQRNACICGDIVEVLGQPQSTVSQHLKMMKDVGLIRGDIDGPRVCYCLDNAIYQRFLTIMNAIKPVPCCEDKQ